MDLREGIYQSSASFPRPILIQYYAKKKTLSCLIQFNNMQNQKQFMLVQSDSILKKHKNLFLINFGCGTCQIISYDYD